jgi:hypothetical protein
MKKHYLYSIVLNDPAGRDGSCKAWTGVVEETAPSFMDGVEDAVREARKTFATHYVDYDSYSNDSDYLDDLDRVAARFEVLRVCKAGNPRTYFVRASLADDPDGPHWSGHVSAVDEEDARFQAAWRAAKASSGGGELPDNGSTVAFDEFFEAMLEYRIEICHLEAVRKDDALALVQDLSDFLTGDRDDRDALLERARRMMRQAGRDGDPGDNLRQAAASYRIAAP